MEKDNLKELFAAMPELNVPEQLDMRIMQSVVAASRRRMVCRNVWIGLLVGVGSLGVLVVALAVLSRFVDFTGVVDSVDGFVAEGFGILRQLFSSLSVRLLCLAFVSGVLISWFGRRFERWLDRRERTEL